MVSPEQVPMTAMVALLLRPQAPKMRHTAEAEMSDYILKRRTISDSPQQRRPDRRAAGDRIARQQVGAARDQLVRGEGSGGIVPRVSFYSLWICSRPGLAT